MFRVLLIVISMLFVGCGGGGGTSSEEAVSKDEKILVLKVNRISVGAFSDIPRIEYTIDSDMVTFANISINKEAEIALKGADSGLFELKESGENRMQLSLIKFKDKPSKDANSDGLYEVNIVATDRSNQIATCKIAYRINIVKPKAEAILEGNLFYMVDSKGVLNNGYTELAFGNGSMVEYQFIDDELINERSQKLYYANTKIVLIKDEKKSVCSIENKTNFISLECKDDANTTYTTIAWRELIDARKNPFLSNSERMVSSKTIMNLESSSAPTISKFALVGTSLSKDATAQLDKNINGGAYKVLIELDKKLQGDEKAYIFFHKASSLDIQRAGNRLVMKSLSASTSLEAKILEDDVHQFSITGQSVILDNSEKFMDETFNGYLNLFICEDILSFISCNYADIPVTVVQ